MGLAFTLFSLIMANASEGNAMNAVATVLTEQEQRLSYRDIADHFGISADAARMKARRKAKAGRWRIIPGNHPNDTVLVEIPVEDLTERVGGERRATVQGERTLRTIAPERANESPERVLELLAAAISLLKPAQDQIERLHAELMEAKEAHRRDAMELVAAETREMGTKADLERALHHVDVLRRRLAKANRPLWRKALGLSPKTLA